MGNLGKCCPSTSEEEQKYITHNKAEIDKIINSLFVSKENFNIKDERFKNFFELMEVFEYQNYFLIKVDQFIYIKITENTFNSLKQIFSYILLNIYNKSINEEFIQIFGRLYSLSNKIYYTKNGEKIFLKDEREIKEKEIFENKEIWKKKLEYSINRELNKRTNKLNDSEIKTIAYSTILNISNDMKLALLSIKKIKDILSPFIIQYNLTDDFKNQLHQFLISNNK